MFLLKEEIPLWTVTLITLMLCRMPPANTQVLEEPLEFLLQDCRGSVLEAQVLWPGKALGGGLVQPRKGKACFKPHSQQGLS